MTMDDRLRRAIEDHTERVEPGPGGWDRIQEKKMDAQRRRLVQRSTLAVLAAAALVALVLGAVAVFDDDNGQDVAVGGDPSSSTTTADDSTSSSGPVTTIPAAKEAIWPAGASSYTDPVEAATAFMREYVGMTAPVAGPFQQGDSRSGEVAFTPKPGLDALTTTVAVRQFDGESWWVVAAESRNVRLDSPGALETITSPVTVRGAARAFEGNVLVSVREDGMERGESLGQAPVTGSGSDELGPFEGSIDFRSPTQSGGALVLTTDSAEDGSIQEATVVRAFFDRPGEEVAAGDCREGAGSGPATTTSTTQPVTIVRVYLVCGDVPAGPDDFVAVARLLPETQGVLRASVEQLLTGPTASELAAGFTSIFDAQSAGLVDGVTIREGTAIVDFDQKLPEVVENAGTSAGTGLLLGQLNRTVFHLETVERAEYRIDGSCEAFGDWLQIGECTFDRSDIDL